MAHSRPSAKLWSGLRLAMAALIAAAIIAQASTTVRVAGAAGRDLTTTLVNFFSFFTVLSNLSSAVVLLWAALWFWRGSDSATTTPRILATALACVTTYMLVTGVVYNTLLRGIELPQGTTVAWSNEVLHLIGPLFLLADVFLGPKPRPLPRRAVLEILVFPIVWVVYTLVRGPLVTNPATGEPWWYPYPFLNPNPGGYGSVAMYVAGIAVLVTLFAWFVVSAGVRRARVPVQNHGNTGLTSQ